MTAAGKATEAATGLNEAGVSVTHAQTSLENAAGSLRSAAEDVVGGGGTGGELADRAQQLVDDAEKLVQASAALQSDVEEWVGELSR